MRRLVFFGIMGCSAPHYDLSVEILDDEGRALAEGSLIVGDTVFEADRKGRVRLPRRDKPVLAVAEAPGHLSRPVALGEPTQVPVQVTLTPSLAGGRVALHFAGDLMLGRRYVSPEDGSLPLLEPGDGGASAAAIVSDIAPAFAAADLSFVNLETVVGTLSDAEAYPGKRWLLQTPPEGLAALDALGADRVVLANNHQRDWLDLGMASTLEALDDAGVPYVGGGMTLDDSRVPALDELGNLTIATLAYTSVNGDFVNDQYPTDGDTPPDDLPAEDAWLWETRRWGSSVHGIASEERRIGSAWGAIEDAEADLAEREAGDLWASAVQVYPELQDWVARRGHGGANPWLGEASVAEIASAAEDADFTVVQLHMGFQFQPSPGSAARSAAEQAAEAGADLVVAHHPHVLQGVEWLGDTLVIWSLGNFVFDQNFQTTFASAFLRVEINPDGSLYEASLFPLRLDAYRPVPITGHLARQTVRTMWAHGLRPALSKRGADLRVRPVFDPAERAPLGMRWAPTGASITQEQPEIGLIATLSEAGTVRLPADALYVPPDEANLEVGRIVSSPGDFEDVDTDSVRGEALEWTWGSDDVQITHRDAALGLRSLQLVRGPDNDSAVLARPVARAFLPDHRLFDAEGTPLDGDPSYTVEIEARLLGESGTAWVRVVLYDFDDLDPTRAPSSAVLGDLVLPLPAGPEWAPYSIEVPQSAFQLEDGRSPNMAMLYVGLDPPHRRSTVLRVDEVALMEWRPAQLEPGPPDAYDALRGPAGTKVALRALSLTE